MTIGDIRSCMHNFEEAVYLGTELEIAGERTLLAGIFREEDRLMVCLFAEDEDVTELQEERVKMEKKRRRGTLTRREEKLTELKEGGDSLLQIIRGIRVHGAEYEFRSGSGGRMEEYNLEGRGLVYQLVHHGVSFGFLEERPLSMVQYLIMELEGEYDRIPFEEEDLKALEFMTVPRHYHVPVKQKIKASVGAQSGKMRKFYCEKLQKEIPYYINYIELADTFSEMQERYDTMREEQPSGEQGFSQRDYELLMNYLKEICPPGMRNLQIEYECEEASLEFYTKKQLQEKVKINPGTGATAFFLAGKSTRKEGMHGKRMKVCFIQHPVEADIAEIELELLSAFVQE